MIKYILGLLFVANAALAQSSGGGVFTYLSLRPTTLPSTCHLGDLRFDSATSVLQFCNNSNAWNPYVYGSIGGGATVAQGGTGQKS